MRASRRVEIADRIRAAGAICVDFAAPTAHSGDPFVRFAPLLNRGGAPMSAIESKKRLTASLLSACGLSCPI